MDSRSKVDQNELGAFGCAITDSKPNHLGWATTENASLAEVRVFGDDGEAVFPGVLPYLIV